MENTYCLAFTVVVSLGSNTTIGKETTKTLASTISSILSNHFQERPFSGLGITAIDTSLLALLQTE